MTWAMFVSTSCAMSCKVGIPFLEDPKDIEEICQSEGKQADQCWHCDLVESAGEESSDDSPCDHDGNCFMRQCIVIVQEQ